MVTTPVKTERRTSVDDVFDALHEQISTLELKPGDRISEAEIAAQFGVSRQPVRDAFSRLANLDLLLIRPQRSTEVRRFSMRQIEKAKSNGVTAKEIIETARDILASPKLMGNELSGKSRWNAQPSPAQNAILPRSEDSSVAGDSHSNDSVSPQSEATTPPNSQRQIDFHLEFLEYQNVSPLSVASKKMSSDIIAAIGFLES